MQRVMSAFVATGFAFLIAASTDPPPMREGLWSVHTETTNNPIGKKSEGSYTLCRDHTFDSQMREQEKGQKGCTVAEHIEDGGYSSEIHCKMGSRTMVSKDTTTFKGDTEVHEETHTWYSPAIGGVTDSLTVMDSKYDGSCPEGVMPGDRTDPGGSVVHLGKH
jgi:hypothetical protein